MRARVVWRGRNLILTEPKIDERPEQHYAGTRASESTKGIAGFIDESFPAVFAHLEKEGVHRPVPSSFATTSSTWIGSWRSRLASPFQPPSGPRAESSHASFQQDDTEPSRTSATTPGWSTRTRPCRRRGNRVSNGAMTATEHGDRFESRLEAYLTDPTTEPDPHKWERMSLASWPSLTGDTAKHDNVVTRCRTCHRCHQFETLMAALGSGSRGTAAKGLWVGPADVFTHPLTFSDQPRR